MLWRTHVLLGTSFLWLVSGAPAILSAGTAGVMAACSAFGALVPDLDAGGAKIAHLSIGRIEPLGPLSRTAWSLFGHRGAMHSLLGAAAFGGPAALALGLWLGFPASVAVLLGYASHLLGDACTVSGVPLLFPDRKRRFALPKPLRFVTGSRTEDFLLLLFAEMTLALFLRFLRA